MAREFISAIDAPVVETKAGKLRGFCLDGIYTFQGIEYAYADRFQAPKPVEPWEGIKSATNYGYICPVPDEPAPSSEIFIPHRFWPANEHCQFLNVWTPGINDGRKRPVMVWFHGGGFSNGSSIEQVAYEGDKLAEYGDVVVVTVNHRLNILGFLDMSSFGEKYANSVNAGVADLVAALQWVHDNIAAFGGDPDNVLIFGQSGGGGKVKTLMNVPAAAGLFHKAIMMSGGCRVSTTTNADHREMIEKMLEVLGLTVDQVEELENVPYDVLVRAYEKVSDAGNMRWGPVANDWYLGDPFTVGFSDYAKTVPTICGTVIAEFTALRNLEDYSLSAEEKEKLVREKFGAEADSLIAMFKDAYPGKDVIVLNRLDTNTRAGALKFCEIKEEASSAPTYNYMVALCHDVMGGVPAWHCGDIPFVFHNAERVGNCNIAGVTETLEDQMAGAWVAFAYSGNPNHAGLPKWKEFGQEKNTMVFDRESVLRTNYDRELIDTIERVCPPMTIDQILKQNATKDKDNKPKHDWMY